jgi:hypothetical protein
MEYHNQHIFDCAHCAGTGTCTKGKNETSCVACIKRNDLTQGLFSKIFSKTQDHTGLSCGTCGGLGKTDTLTHRMNNRTAPLLAISIIAFCFTLIFFALFKNEHLSEILTFCGTLIGSVVGYYFSGKNTSRNFN